MGLDSAHSGFEYTVMRSSHWILLVCLLLSGCDFRKGAPANSSSSLEEINLTVFAAVSLTGAFSEIAEVFETNNPDVKVTLHFAGSQQLAQQIRHGAPVDVFASANQIQMNVAVSSGRIMPASPIAFARNQLSAVVPSGNPALLHTIEDLARPGLVIVLADEAVPAGQYSMDFLVKASQVLDASYRDDVLANVASYEQNVRAVLTKVSLGEADAGIVYMSDLVGSQSVLPVEIPATYNPETVYPIAPLADSDHPDIARRFVSFVQSMKGQLILSRHGFIPKEPA